MMLWKRNEDVELEMVEDKLLIFDINLFSFYELNETMTLIWSLLENKISEDMLAEALVKEFDVPKSVAIKDVADAIKMLKEKELISQIN